jgi:hypothetical protein
VIVFVLGTLAIVPIPFAVLATVFWTAAQPHAPALVVVPVLALIGLLLLAVWFYVNAAFMFALPLVHDRGYEFWPAMRLSQRIVNEQLLPTVALVLLAGLIWLTGLLALCLGIFVAAPIIVASFACAYEDLFGAEAAA